MGIPARVAVLRTHENVMGSVVGIARDSEIDRFAAKTALAIGERHVREHPPIGRSALQIYPVVLPIEAWAEAPFQLGVSFNTLLTDDSKARMTEPEQYQAIVRPAELGMFDTLKSTDDVV